MRLRVIFQHFFIYWQIQLFVSISFTLNLCFWFFYIYLHVYWVNPLLFISLSHLSVAVAMQSLCSACFFLYVAIYLKGIWNFWFFMITHVFGLPEAMLRRVAHTDKAKLFHNWENKSAKRKQVDTSWPSNGWHDFVFTTEIVDVGRMMLLHGSMLMRHLLKHR